MGTWTFAAQTTFRGTPVALTGAGDNEESALRDALNRSLNIDYRHNGSHYERGVTANDLHALTQSDTILGGEGGWVAIYRWDTGPHAHETAEVWIGRGRVQS